MSNSFAKFVWAAAALALAVPAIGAAAALDEPTQQKLTMWASCAAIFQVAAGASKDGDPKMSAGFADLAKQSAQQFAGIAKAASVPQAGMDGMIRQAVTRVVDDSEPKFSKFEGVLKRRMPVCLGMMDAADAQSAPQLKMSAGPVAGTQRASGVWSGDVTLEALMPSTWHAVISSPGAAIPAALTLTSPDQKRVKVLITPMADTRPANERQGGIDAFARSVSEEYLAGSVEKKCDIVRTSGKSGPGSYCVTTDSSLVGKKKLPPGEYRQVTSGVVLAMGSLLHFTVLSNDTISADYRKALDIVANGLNTGVGYGMAKPSN